MGSLSSFLNILVLLTAVSSARAANSTIQWVNCTDHIPQPLQTQAQQLPKELPPTLKCGTLQVAMNYSEPMSKNNTIELGFAMYRPENPQGLLNFNPGGPNAEVASNAWLMALNVSGGEIFQGLTTYDFLAIDQRGTYQSTPLNCTAEFHLPSSLPNNETSYKAYHDAIGPYAQSCVDNSVPNGILQHLETSATVQDWDAVRSALGYETMNHLGLSYGTYGGSTYAHKYPDRVGKFVLDAVFPHGLNKTDLVTNQIKAQNRLLERSDDYCLNDPSCPFHGEGKGSVIKAYGCLLEKAKQGNSQNVTEDDFRATIYIEYLNSSPNFPALNEGLYLGMQGNWSGFQYAPIEEIYTPAFLPVLPTICLDQARGDNSWEAFNSLLQAVKENDENCMAYTQDMTLLALCGGWPYYAEEDPKLEVDSEMLLVIADFDMNTPAENGIYEYYQTTNSSLIVRHGDDHVSIENSDILRQIEVQYLLNGTLPSSSPNETILTIYGPGETIAGVEDPHSVPVGPIAGDIYQTSNTTSSASAA